MKLPGLKCPAPACGRVLWSLGGPDPSPTSYGYQAVCSRPNVPHQWRVHRFKDSTGRAHITLRWSEGKGGAV